MNLGNMLNEHISGLLKEIAEDAGKIESWSKHMDNEQCLSRELVEQISICNCRIGQNQRAISGWINSVVDVAKEDHKNKFTP